MKIKIFLLSALALFIFSSINGQNEKKLKINIRNDVNYTYSVSGHYGDGGTTVFFSGTATASSMNLIEFQVPLSYLLKDLRISAGGSNDANFNPGPYQTDVYLDYPPTSGLVKVWQELPFFPFPSSPDVYYYFKIY